MIVITYLCSDHDQVHFLWWLMCWSVGVTPAQSAESECDQYFVGFLHHLHQTQASESFF